MTFQCSYVKFSYQLAGEPRYTDNIVSTAKGTLALHDHIVISVYNLPKEIYKMSESCSSVNIGKIDLSDYATSANIFQLSSLL